MRRANIDGTSYVGGGQRMYEEENEALQDDLRTKVSALKCLSIEMGNEIKVHNSVLSEMDSAFDSTGGLLGATMGRLKKISGGSQARLMCYLMLFALFVIFVLYWVIRLR
ncbi:BET1 homolog [Petromyzon marinus]|uniref:BET1 homolog n=1 Tax=Petromyzon marinus TaxID=7757 RepID=A0AAJ7WX08_PETMA|nr:BET1 homolog [Petromyzon marinus]